VPPGGRLDVLVGKHRYVGSLWQPCLFC
jgi:hypothetical protein